jgi:hypothetical protein
MPTRSTPTRPTTNVPVSRLPQTAQLMNTIAAASQKVAADLQMSKAGESRLKEELFQRSEQQKADTRKIPNGDDTSAGGGETDGGLRPRLVEELLPRNYLVERKRKRDEEEENTIWKKNVTGCGRNPKVLAETEAEVQIRGGVDRYGCRYGWAANGDRA